MRADIVPGAVFPDYELSDQHAVHRKLSDLQQGDPLVLVLSRGGFCPKERRQQEGLLQRIVDALSGLPVRAVATLGRMLEPDAARSSPNVQVVPSAPHTAILREASVAVTHCGHGTTMRALAAGVPMVCIPMGRDQNDTAARVVHHGAGVRLPPSASTAKIRAAVLRVLADDQFRANAARLATVLAHEHHPADVAIELEGVAGDVPSAPPDRDPPGRIVAGRDWRLGGLPPGSGPVDSPPVSSRAPGR